MKTIININIYYSCTVSRLILGLSSEYIPPGSLMRILPNVYLTNISYNVTLNRAWQK